MVLIGTNNQKHMSLKINPIKSTRQYHDYKGWKYVKVQ